MAPRGASLGATLLRRQAGRRRHPGLPVLQPGGRRCAGCLRADRALLRPRGVRTRARRGAEEGARAPVGGRPRRALLGRRAGGWADGVLGAAGGRVAGRADAGGRSGDAVRGAAPPGDEGASAAAGVRADQVMMNKDLIYVIEQIGREKGIGKEVLFEALESALLSASKKTMGAADNVRMQIDRQTGSLRVSARKKVVDAVTDPKLEITLDEARRLNAAVEM